MKSLMLNSKMIFKMAFVTRLLKTKTAGLEKQTRKFENIDSENKLVHDNASMEVFKRKVYMGNFMAGPFVNLHPGFFKERS